MWSSIEIRTLNEMERDLRCNNVYDVAVRCYYA